MSTTMFFGPRWDAPIVDRAEQVPTPVGMRCYDCAEPVADGDRGFLRPCGRDDDGRLAWSVEPVHAECELAGVMGHMVGVCSCTGYEPGRATAREVWRRVYAGRE